MSGMTKEQDAQYEVICEFNEGPGAVGMFDDRELAMAGEILRLREDLLKERNPLMTVMGFPVLFDSKLPAGEFRFVPASLPDKKNNADYRRGWNNAMESAAIRVTSSTALSVELRDLKIPE